MIKIISFTICPFVQRVTSALEARNIRYEVEYIQLNNKPEWFLDISPNGQVPLLITEKGTVLFESESIVEYIEDEYGSLINSLSNEDKSLYRAWSYLGSKNYLVQCGVMRSKDKESFEERKSNLFKSFDKIEKALSKDYLYFNSNVLSNVDIAWIPLLYRIHIIEKETLYDFLFNYPKIKFWKNNLLKIEWINNTVSKDFILKFKNFYLIDSYLGTY